MVDEQSGEYLARHPAAALGRLIAERLDRLAEESGRSTPCSGSIRRLIRDYDAGHDYRRGPFPVELVSGADELYESVMGMAVQAPPMELLIAIPDERTMADFATEIRRPVDRRAQRTGCSRCRVIIPVHTLASRRCATS